MSEQEKAISRIKELNEKNKNSEYSLGDVLLLDKFEKELRKLGFSNNQLRQLSPSYYRKK